MTIRAWDEMTGQQRKVKGVAKDRKGKGEQKMEGNIKGIGKDGRDKRRRWNIIKHNYSELYRIKNTIKIQLKIMRSNYRT